MSPHSFGKLHPLVAIALLLQPCWGMRVVEAPPSGHPKLCDEHIVRAACARLNAWSAFSEEVRTADQTTVHATEVARQLSVARSSVASFFAAAALENVASTDVLGSGAYAVDCQQLCERTLAMIPAKHRPPTSDVACYREEGREEPVCDVDVSDAALDFAFPDHSEKVAATAFHEARRAGAPGNATETLRDLEDAAFPEALPRVVRTGIANLFRIYPLMNVDLTSEDGTFSFLEVDDEADGAALRAERAANDAKCQEAVPMSTSRSGLHLTGPGCKCPAGTLLTGSSPECASRSEQLRKFNAEDLAGKGCMCRRPSFGPESCVDRDLSCATQKGNCHQPQVQDSCPGTCGVDCASFPVLADFARDATEVSVKAQAYVAKAVARVTAKAVPKTVRKWFGADDERVRAAVLRVLNGISQMLMNVEYVYPNWDCGENTYAYVRPHWPFNKNSRGQYIIHLCPFYMKVDIKEKIETITHEGSHHSPMSTGDECLQGMLMCNEMAYGRTNCEELARKAPEKALTNADSFCYFISDAARCTGNC